MRRKRQGNLVTAGLALCVAILALLAAFMNFDEVSTARGAPAEETPVIGLWGAGILADIVPPGEQTPVLSVEGGNIPGRGAHKKNGFGGREPYRNYPLQTPCGRRPQNL